jgi:hypothetical protein
MFKPLMSKIMTEAHARAKADVAWDRANSKTRMALPYSYYLGLQMRNGFAEARVAITGMAPSFQLPPQRWA